VWNESGASLPFFMKPHFYQTIWFYLLCTLAVFGTALGFHRQKMSKANKEFVAVLSERARIAREIHDGLTQALAGVVMQLETARLLPAGDQAQKHLERALTLARQSVEDARRTIGDLRPQPFSAVDFPEGLRSMVRHQIQDSPVQFAFHIVGTPVKLPANVQPEVLRISQESVHNALKHASASTIAVELHYDASSFRMIVQDNGKGFDAGSPPPAGHFGMQGMRERASAIHAEILVESQPRSGTRIELILPL
jgi:signal transduction histidine kinase